MIPLLLACTVEGSQPPMSSALELEDFTLEVGERVSVHATRGVLQTSGRGHGEEVQAVLSTETAASDSAPGAAPPPLKIEADRSDWDLSRQEVSFEGGVTLVRGAFTLTCQELKVGFASPEQVDWAVATGDVEISRDELRAQGQKAELTAATGRVVLTGSPELHEGPNRLRGNRLVLWLDQERVECESCELIVHGDGLRPEP